MTAAIQLRRYGPDDVEASYEAVVESFAELSRWMVWCNEDYCLERAHDWVGRQASDWDANLSWNFVISDNSGRYLGSVGLHSIDLQNQVAEAGYWVRTSAAGAGVATAAIAEITRWGFEVQGLHRLEVIASVENLASQRVAEKAGFKREAVLSQRLSVGGGRHDGVLLAKLKPSQPGY